jgi:hypothetical protein
LILYLEKRSGSSKKRVFKVRLSFSKLSLSFFQVINSVGFMFFSMMCSYNSRQIYHKWNDFTLSFLSSPTYLHKFHVEV